MRQIQEMLTARPSQTMMPSPQRSGPVTTIVPGGTSLTKPVQPIDKKPTQATPKIVQKVKQKVIVAGKDVTKKTTKTTKKRTGKRAKKKTMKIEYSAARKSLMSEYRKFYKKIHRKLKTGENKTEMLAKLRKVKKDFIKSFPAPSSVRMKQVEKLLSSIKQYKWTV